MVLVYTTHLNLKGRLFEEDIPRLQVHASTSSIAVDDLVKYFVFLSVDADFTLREQVGNCSGSLTAERLTVFTGLSWDQLECLERMLTSMRSVEGRTVIQALVIFLFKMRTGNSNATVAAVFGLPRAQQVSQIFDSVMQAFEKDVLPFTLDSLPDSL